MLQVEPSQIEYLDALLYFCCTSNALEGLLRALSVACQHRFVNPFASNVEEEDDANNNPSNRGGAVADDGLEIHDDEPIITFDALLRVFTHGSKVRENHRFESAAEKQQSVAYRFLEFDSRAVYFFHDFFLLQVTEGATRGTFKRGH